MRKYKEKLKRDPYYFKPRQYRDTHLTIKELAVKIGRDPSYIKKLEKRGKIPLPARVKRGKLKIRLYSPSQVEEIDRIINDTRT